MHLVSIHLYYLQGKYTTRLETISILSINLFQFFTRCRIQALHKLAKGAGRNEKQHGQDTEKDTGVPDLVPGSFAEKFLKLESRKTISCVLDRHLT